MGEKFGHVVINFITLLSLITDQFSNKTNEKDTTEGWGMAAEYETWCTELLVEDSGVKKQKEI